MLYYLCSLQYYIVIDILINTCLMSFSFTPIPDLLYSICVAHYYRLPLIGKHLSSIARRLLPSAF